VRQQVQDVCSVWRERIAEPAGWMESHKFDREMPMESKRCEEGRKESQTMPRNRAHWLLSNKAYGINTVPVALRLPAQVSLSAHQIRPGWRVIGCLVMFLRPRCLRPLYSLQLRAALRHIHSFRRSSGC
jgi:hypothetical protein